MDLYRNFAWSLVVTAPVPPTTGTTLTVEAGTVYPVPPFNVVVCPEHARPLASNAEILRVTARVGDQLTVTRHAEGSSARGILPGDQIYQGVTEQLIADLLAAI